MDDGVIKRFMSLFAGYTLAYGRTTVHGTTSAKGKAESRSWTVHEPVTAGVWHGHLTGKNAIGIIPLADDDRSLSWGVIDIDVYGNPALIFDIERRIVALGLPLVVCRSKSGGAHCFCFLEQPMAADEVMERLRQWAAAIGYPTVEVFPKQIERHIASGDSGNWLNMPYYKGADTERYAVKNGQALSIMEFLEYAESKQVSVEDFRKTDGGDDPEMNVLFLDGPPCLKAIYKGGGLIEGQGVRNLGMYAVGVYVKKRYGDEWRAKFEEYNQKLCHPPMSKAEFDVLSKSLAKKQYDYNCRSEPIKTYCNRGTCKGCKFGVGKGAQDLGITWEKFEKHEGDPVLWFGTINDKRILFKTEDLLDQRMFQKRLFEEITILAPSMTPARWRAYLQDLLDRVEIMQPPEAASAEGQFRILLQRYAHGNAQAESKDEIINGNPWFSESGYVHFKAEGLYKYLANQGFKTQSGHHVWQWVQNLGGKNIFDAELGEYWIVPMKKPDEAKLKPTPNFESNDF